MINELLRQILFLPLQRSTVAMSLDMLHYVVISVTMGGATLVAVCAAYFMIRYRRRTTDVTRAFPGATAKPWVLFEIAAVVALVVAFLVFWVVGVRQYTRIRVSPENAITVYVTAKQWMWKFAYPEGPSSVATLYVPARRPVKLVMTSRDVIHSFYVPDFRVKYDAVPGRYTTLWFEATEPGTYPILCTEYCGTDHSIMRGEVIALSESEYARWLADHGAGSHLLGQKQVSPAAPGASIPPEPTSLVRLGENIAAEQGCMRCHTPDGTPHIGPTWASLYMAKVPLQGGGTVIADDAYLTESMMDPLAKLHRGYQPVMPSYLGRLRPADVAAILEYIRSLRSVAPEPGARTPDPSGPPFVRSGPLMVAPPSGTAPRGPVDGARERPAIPGLEPPMWPPNDVGRTPGGEEKHP